MNNESLGAIFSTSVERFPDRPALFIADRHWSFRSLDQEARSIEAALHRAGLTGRRYNIGLLYARSAFSYAAIIAILRSGNVYVPLNDKLAAERLATIIQDADIATLVMDKSDALSDGVLAVLNQSPSLRIISNDSLRTVEPGVSAEPTFGDSSDLAYIIFTSGSTGTPKGVPIRHESVFRCMDRLRALFGTRETDRFTQFCPLSFDGSIFELFLCWISGACSYVPAASDALVPFKFVKKHGVTVWGSVPSLANFMLKLNLLTSNAFPEIRLSFFFGEALPAELAVAWGAAAPAARIFNLYGPTEFTICATYYEIDRAAGPGQGMVPIGVMLADQKALIVDDGRVVHEEGEPGELWLSGDQLALGYWKNPTATAAAFVHFPAGDSQADLWYRTGDVVSFRAGAGMYFRGRLDRQVKLRGLRIELQEVENALREVTGCARVAVVPICNAGGMCERIFAYCDELDLDEEAVKARCLKRLPSYMVPERILQISEFPVSNHGKTDYQLLAARARGMSV